METTIQMVDIQYLSAVEIIKALNIKALNYLIKFFWIVFYLNYLYD